MSSLKTELTYKDLKFEVDTSPSKENIDYLLQGFRDYNRSFLGTYSTKLFTICIKNQEEKIIAGVFAKLFISPYVDVDVLWVHPDYRMQGLGTLLNQKLEEYVKDQGYNNIRLETYSYHARPFYEKIGYQCVGTLPKWLFKFDRYFMQKELK